MQASPIWKALVPLFARMARPVREHEVLRVAATIDGTRKQKPANAARQEVLAWAQRRSGGRLPQEAWQHRDFEYFSGGRNSIGVRIQTEQADVWAIRAEDPDKQIPGRIWTTEVVVGTLADQPPRFSVRLLASTAEDELDIEPHVPGLVQQIAEQCGLARGRNLLAAAPRIIRSYEEVDDLCDQMVDQNRKLPLFVLTVPEDRTNQEEPLLDANSLSGGDGSAREEPVSDGVRNAHCGKDSFDFTWQGNQYTADWHIKNGGNTRDPSRCLRIYYAWDASTQQMIVADMPYHRRTGAT